MRAKENLFFSKNDPQDPRLGEFAKAVASAQEDIKASVSLMGYPDDEGIAISKGRLGAKQGPDFIRQYFYKMTPALGFNGQIKIADAGDIDTDGDLENRHKQAKTIIKNWTEEQRLWITMGGGHDYGYADGAGFLGGVKSSKKPLIINFDAHLDVRPTLNGLSSGTPFFRLLNEFKGKFDFVEIGLQSQCNSSQHWQWAIDHGAHLFSLETCNSKGLDNVINAVMDDFADRDVFLSVDIDAFSYAYAPGCSQSWASGLNPQDFFPALSTMIERSNIRGLGIYEVSPPLDIDNHTSKLAAEIMHHFLFKSLSRVKT